ncbi:MAG TPA: DUF3422 domain-containing protein [Vineibacter sp.]|nr:DUF3422 domain-containing protein [Vineibacter sp.]
MILPANHPQRITLNDEVHARPPQPLRAPSRLSYLALLSPSDQRTKEWHSVSDLCRRFDAPAPEPSANHHSADFGPLRLIWERHTEFARYTFVAQGEPDVDPPVGPALAAVPAEWIAALPGQMMVATHVEFVPHVEGATHEEIASRHFTGNQLIGAAIAGGAAFAFTDYRIHEDGFGRLLIQDRSMTPRQAGRMIQRLLEIDTYRMMALLALPVAQEAAPFLVRCERDLTDIAIKLASAGEQDEPRLLDRLTALEAAIAGGSADNYFRFSAAVAYYELVQRRILDLREERLQGLQTFQEFIERRLAPAMNTCRSVAARQDMLSSQVTRATQLLSTRVNVTRERQNQEVLSSMNQRAALQLRLQTTVERLSIAAVTYYVVGLVGYAAKALTSVGINVNAEIAMGVSIPVVVGLMALGVRSLHKLVVQHR